jgi:hypothetical protein
MAEIKVFEHVKMFLLKSMSGFKMSLIDFGIELLDVF